MKLIESLMDQTVPGLQKALDLTWRRNEIIASNIANAETPQYRASDLSFGNELKAAFNQQTSALKVTDPRHLDLSENSSAHSVADLSGVTKSDGNNVDIDIQMGELSYNSSKYSSAARLLRKKIGMLKMAIREGSR